jgi:hypothetical protein
VHLNSERSAVPRWVTVVAGASLAVLAFTATPEGAAFAASVQAFLAFFGGVLSLVAYSGAVMIGLLATERTVLGIRHRVMAQAAHRTMAVSGTAFLLAHILIKVLSRHATVLDAVTPHLTKVGAGAIAGDLFLMVLVTGIVRAWFVQGKGVWVWRVLHALSYVAWPISILHGLTAGRAPNGLGVGPLGPWATVAYIVCLLGVGFALLMRLAAVVQPGPLQKPEHIAARQTPVTTTVKPVQRQHQRARHRQ